MLSGNELSARLRRIRGDSTLNELLDEYLLQPKLLKDIGFSRSLASELGVQGFVAEAITLNERMLKKGKRVGGDVHIDLAVMYGQFGDQEKKRSHFERVPKESRQGTAYANLLNDFGYREAAIACYEQSCRANGARLYLSFLNLAFMYDFGSQERAYWLHQGYIQHPREIGIILPYAIHCFTEGDWESVLDIDPRSIDQSFIPGVIRSRTVCEQVGDLGMLQSLARGILEHDEPLTIQCGSFIADLKNGYGCEPLKKFLLYLQESGMISAVRKFYPGLCAVCRQSVDFPGLLMETAIASSQQDCVREIYLECGDALSPMIRLSYASALDDFRESSSALEIISSYDYFEGNALAVQLRAKYDSYFYALRTGRFLLAAELIRWVCSLSKEAIQSLYSSQYDGLKSVPHGYFDELIKWRAINEFLAEVLCRQFDLADECIGRLLSKTSVESEAGFVIEEVNGQAWGVSHDFAFWLSELLAWARENQESSYYTSHISNRFTQAALQFGLPNVGQLRPERSSKSVNTLLLLGGKSRLVALTNWRTQAAINEEMGDMSHLTASLRSYIPAFSTLSEGSQAPLFNAEHRYISSGVSFDPASTIHSFCKGLEIELRDVYFERLRQDIRQLENFLELIDEAKASKNIRQTANVVRYLEGGFAELGVMVRCLQFASGKTARAVPLFGLIRGWLELQAPCMLEEKFIDQLNLLIRDFRNPSAHNSVHSLEDVTSARALAGALLSELTRPRSINL